MTLRSCQLLTLSKFLLPDRRALRTTLPFSPDQEYPASHRMHRLDELVLTDLCSHPETSAAAENVREADRESKVTSADRLAPFPAVAHPDFQPIDGAMSPPAAQTRPHSGPARGQPLPSSRQPTHHQSVCSKLRPVDGLPKDSDETTVQIGADTWVPIKVG